MTELKPCPFCGGEAHAIEPARYGKSWGVRCECGAFLGFEYTEAEAIAAWNTRAATTIGKAQVEVEPVLRGTLTAEQVREAIFSGSSYASYDGAKYYADGIGMQAVADELNAKLDASAERTCNLIEDGDGDSLHCSNCGGAAEKQSWAYWSYCPNCGARVLRNTLKYSETDAKAVGE